MIEKEILSSALLSQDKLYTVLEYENIFTEPCCRRLRDVMEQLVTSGAPVDMMSVELADPSLSAFLLELYSLPTVYSVKHTMEQLRKNHIIRSMRDASRDLAGAKNDADIDKFLGKIVELYESMNHREDNYCEFKDYHDKDLLDIYKDTTCIKTGFEAIDEKVFGLFNSDLIILAARPALGKTSLAFQMACNIPGSVFFSLEMPRLQLLARKLSSEARVEAKRIMSRRLNSDEVRRVNQAKEGLKGLDLRLYDKVFDAEKIFITIQRLCESGKKPSAVFVDYLQKIHGGRGESQNIRVGNISSRFKTLAQTYDIPIILLSQLSRECEREGRKPELHDLRDSGTIEQDANMVLFLYDNKGMYEIIVAKDRSGRTGIIREIRFIREYTRFEPIYQSTRFEDGVIA